MIGNKTKSFFVIFIILIIGIALGFELSEMLMKNRLEKFRNSRDPKGFVESFDNVIKPDAKQKPIVDSIIIKHHKIMDKLLEDSRAQMDKMADSLAAELKPVLTKEQMDRLTADIAKMRKNPPPGPMPKERPGEQMRNDRPPDFDGHRPPPPPNN